MAAKKTADAVVREYDRLAPDYDRRWSFYIGATIRETLGRIDLQLRAQNSQASTRPQTWRQVIVALNTMPVGE